MDENAETVWVYLSAHLHRPSLHLNLVDLHLYLDPCLGDLVHHPRLEVDPDHQSPLRSVILLLPRPDISRPMPTRHWTGHPLLRPSS